MWCSRVHEGRRLPGACWRQEGPGSRRCRPQHRRPRLRRGHWRGEATISAPFRSNFAPSRALRALAANSAAKYCMSAQAEHKGSWAGDRGSVVRRHMRRALSGIMSACCGRKGQSGCSMVASCVSQGASRRVGRRVNISSVQRIGSRSLAAREPTRERATQRNSAAHATCAGVDVLAHC